MPHQLDYARTLFAGGFRYRSPQGVAYVCTSAGVGIALAAYLYRFRGFGAELLPPIVLSAYLICIAALFLLRVVLDRRDDFAITTAGIETSGRLNPWSDVRQFAAYGNGDDAPVTLYFVSHAKPGTAERLLTNRQLSPVEYKRLISDLTRELADSYPELEIGGIFPPPD